MPDKLLSYDDYVRLTATADLSTKFTTQQMVCLHKLARNKPLNATDRRVLRMSGITDNEDELTLVGRLCVTRINKKRKRRTGGRRKVFNWEKE